MTHTPSNAKPASDANPADSPAAEPAVGDSERYDQALALLYDRINYERMAGTRAPYRFRLQRITRLLRQLDLAKYLHVDSPTPEVPLAHLAGTKGKGSTAAMVAAVLSAAGLRTGLYTSPHLHRLEERFRVDGDPCHRDELVALVDRIKLGAEQVEQEMGPLSFFELTTALALVHFDTRDCDAIVMEVGLGGRLDSTNVCSPSVSAITSIGLDHQHVLGNDLSTIAGEKAGILKPGVPVVSGTLDVGAAAVIAAKAEAQRSPLFQLGSDFQFSCQPLPDWGSSLHYRGHTVPLSRQVDATLAMEGEHQARNAAVAIAMIDLLRDQGLDVPPRAIAAGLAPLQCNSRVERFLLPENVTAVVDAAHNSDSITALCDCVRRRLAGRPIAVVLGTSIDKEAEPMLRSLAEVADHLVLTRFFGNPRIRPPAEMLPLVPGRLAAQTVVIEEPVEACRRALELVTPGGAMVVCGSFFLAAETRPWIRQLAAT